MKIGFGQSNKIKRHCLPACFASIYYLYLPVELNCKTLLFQRFPTNEQKALRGKHPTEREEKYILQEKCNNLVKFSKMRNKETVYLETARAERRGRIEHTPV